MSVKQTIVMRNDLGMRKGKMISQAAHASTSWLSYRVQEGGSIPLSPPEHDWIFGNFRKVCLQVDSEQQLVDIYHKAKAAGLEVHLITDSGLTEFHNVPTKTCLAIGPDYDEKIDIITSSLKLY